MSRCSWCNEPVQVWADNSGGLTVNFACDNPDCLAGKGPWDTERPLGGDSEARLRQAEDEADGRLDWFYES